jgi:hypothetical protein
VVAAGAPAAWSSDIGSAINQVSAATGLSFVRDGAYNSSTQVPSSSKLTISYASGLTGGDSVGLTTYYYINDPRYVPQITSANVQILSRMASGGGTGGELPVLLHELGHAVGLGHTSGSEVMNPIDQGLSGYQGGDLTGLARLGASAGCGGFYG